MRATFAYAGAVTFLIVAELLAVSGLTAGIVAVGLVVVAVALVCLGPERLGVTFLAFAFGTAPMYKGLAPAGSAVTPTDLCLVVGFALLLPRLLGNSFQLPARYVVAVLVIFGTGVIGSLVSTSPAASLLALGFWLATVFVLPTGVHMWRPSRREVEGMAWAFVAGHMVSTFAGMALGHVFDGRLYGLTNHPNYFAESAVITFGLLLHLLATSRHKALAWAAMAVTVYSVYASGSRAGTLALAAVVAVIPVVERSAIKAYLLSLLGATAAVVLSLQWSTVAGSGSLARLTGQGTAAGSDQERTQGLVAGLHRFLDHPLTGSGLVDLFAVHNNYLEAAIGIGALGLVAFLVVLVTLGKPLLGDHELRRLSYTVVGYAVFGATTPALYDRTYWVAMSLSIVVVAATGRPGSRHSPAVTSLSRTSTAAPLPGPRRGGTVPVPAGRVPARPSVRPDPHHQSLESP
jgi:hypothetical protein